MLVVAASGCRPSASRRPLLDQDPVFVVPAVKEVAQQGPKRVSRGEARKLIDLLDNDDAVVRLSAGEALQELTGRDFGFHSWLGPEERQPIIDRWRQWLAGVEAGK